MEPTIPTFVSMYPPDGAVGVDRTTAIELIFDASISASDISRVTISHRGSAVEGTFETNGNAIRFSADLPYALLGNYVATVDDVVAGEFEIRDGEFSSPMKLDTHDGHSVSQAAVRFSPLGSADVAWTQGSDDDHKNLWHSNLSGSTSQWAPAAVLSPSPIADIGLGGCALGHDVAGSTFFAWLDDTSVLLRKRDAQGSLANTASIERPLTYAYAGWPRVAAGPQGTFVCWQERNSMFGEGQDLVFWMSQLRCTHWSQPEGWSPIVELAATRVSLVEVLSLGDRYTAIYLAQDEGAPRTAVLARDYVPGFGFEAPVEIDAWNEAAPTIAAADTNGTEAVVAFLRPDGLVLSRFEEGWINTPLSIAGIPYVRMSPGGSIAFAWDEGERGSSVLMARIYSEDLGWTNAERVSNTADWRTAAVDVDDEGNAILAFVGTDAAMHAARYTTGAGWGSPVPIDTSGGSTSDLAKIDLGPRGDAVVIWRRDTGLSEDELWVSIFE